ncbi:EamA family transporter RarD [Niallia circulans]|uniref:EamA family transporter RarD n=1 Tax=Niallia circulans TaxID=1397 RepID=A0A553SK03_NIACI|nr:EamA family transporter RarD [Niallia circulans]TRZ37289.1 EamA family transporter RarD [Niallia circulans]
MKDNETKTGILYAVFAYLIWGLFPIYWKNLQGVGADEILANRVLWSFVFMVLLVTITRKWKKLGQVLYSFKTNKKQGFMLFIASVLVSCNWFIYIWAVNANQIIETSLGYYINPLVSVMLGMFVLKEKLTKVQYVSVGLAAIGVLILTISHGSFPWIALSLAFTFGLYGLAKKLISIDSEIGLTLETMFITPIALLYIVYLFVKGDHAFLAGSSGMDVLLMISGVLTAIPLLFFAKGAQRIPLSMLGFIQYMTPTLTLILGVFVYDEPFTSTHLLSFVFIWSALTLYSLSKTKLFSQSNHAKRKDRAEA